MRGLGLQRSDSRHQRDSEPRLERNLFLCFDEVSLSHVV